MTLHEAKQRFRAQLRELLVMTAPGRGVARNGDEAARLFLADYLKKNVLTTGTIDSMRELIEEFRRRAPRMSVLKCIDGRVHGSKGKGYPPTTVGFLRTEGCKLSTNESNTVFWSKMSALELDAMHNTPGMPPVFIALAHTAHQGHGCAAQSKAGLSEVEVVRNSLSDVEHHAKAVRSRYTPGQIYALHGITDTDDMAETLFFQDGTELSSARIIDAVGIRNPAEVFTPAFLRQIITDDSITRYVGKVTVESLMTGIEPPIFCDLTSAIAMEVYLMKQITDGNTGIINPSIFQAADAMLGRVRHLPPSLRLPFMYQTVWNIAYTLFQRNRMKRFGDEERERHLEHAESHICYGEGFELLFRNQAILAKTGRGDDREALRVAKNVLDGNRAKYANAGRPQPHLPIVHINVEVPGELTNWLGFNRSVLVKLQEMMARVKDVFGSEDVCMMTTYSYATQKQFFPVQVNTAETRRPENTSSFPVDIAVGLSESREFKSVLRYREASFSEFVAY